MGEPAGYPIERTSPLHPPDAFAHLRAGTPLQGLSFADGRIGWLASSHALACAILADPRFSVRGGGLAAGDATAWSNMLETFDRHHMRDGNMLSQDPPLHTRLRKLQTRFFTVRAVDAHRRTLEEIVHGCLDRMEAAGPPVDFIELFAAPVASGAASHLLGVNYGEHLAQPGSGDGAEQLPADLQQAAFLERHFDYVHDLIDQKRRLPGDDLLSALVTTEGFTHEELPGAVTLLFAGAAESTASQFTLGVYALLEDEEAWQALVRDPGLVNGAVEELLRYVSVLQFTVRVALEDVEFDGVTIREGESVAVSLEAANRDPERFGDANRLDIRRDASGHVGFGHGRHLCLGQHLARFELQIGLSALVARFPTLRLAIASRDIPDTSAPGALHRVGSLPVEW
jgi:cytochrome P450